MQYTYQSPFFTYKTEKLHRFFVIAILVHFAIFALFLFEKTDEIEPLSFGVQFSVASAMQSKKQIVNEKQEKVIATKNQSNHSVSKEKVHEKTNENSTENDANSDDSSAVEYIIGSTQNPAPKYPAIAKRNEWEGVSKICVQIGADGIVKNANVCQKSGYKILDNSALETIKTWKFHIKNSGKQIYNTSVKINFTLK